MDQIQFKTSYFTGKRKVDEIDQFMSQMNLKVKVNQPYFSNVTERAQNGDSRSNPWRVIKLAQAEHSKVQNDLEVKCQSSPFSKSSMRVSIHDVCYGDSRSNHWRVIARTNTRTSILIYTKMFPNIALLPYSVWDACVQGLIGSLSTLRTYSEMHYIGALSLGYTISKKRV